MNRYPFCLFRIPENGGRVLWEITNTCNYHCSYCIFSSESKKYENELSTEEIKKAIKELKENNFTYIKFTGGEPFTRDDMIEILKYARNLGFDMDISTNGSLITEKIAKELKNMSFPMVHVSLDGENKKSHEYVRGESTFERTLRGIKKEFLEAKTAKGSDGELSDDIAMKILVKMVKQRKDSAQIYIEQNRPELAESELGEAKVIEEYLPKQMTEAELEAELKNIIAEVGATSAKDMGKVMGVASKKLAGRAEGKAISAKVKELLA